MKTLHRLFTFLVVVGLIFSATSPAPAVAQPPAPSYGDPDQPADALREARSKIEPLLLKELETEAARTDFFVWLTEKADLTPAYQLKTKEEKGRFVFETLHATAERTQKELRAHLDAQGISYQPFYISNKILVRGGGQKLLFNLAARPDVARITANRRYQLDKPKIHPKDLKDVLGVEGNIAFVNADDVWALGFTGQGTVLAGNDTGLAWQHPAIKNHYRGWNGVTADHNYNWWDATRTYPKTPNDVQGHGTHTTGTMVGDDGGANQIGMAPGSQTIHCKNMDDWGSGWDSTFIECFQWDLAPWDLNGQNPRSELAPDAVNNSWGYMTGGYPIFEDEIAALQAAGILVEVSAGNEGPSCSTLRSPSDYGDVLTTGSVSHASGTLPGTLTWFSSRGPSTLSPDYIPDVMAPGEGVRSAVPGGFYERWDGTSMAGPHVTGLIGLMWAANPALRGLVAETQQLILAATVPLSGQMGSNCGGDYVTGPNNDWGYGTIDALAAVQAAIGFGGVGTLAGTVTDSVSGAPLAGVRIRASLPPSLTWRTTTNEFGLYSRAVFSGTHTVTAQLYGYYPSVHSGVEVVADATTILDIQMDPAPFYLVSGRVTDVTTGWPLYARIDIEGYPGGPVWSDPLSGQYSISLAAGTNYTLRVGAWVDGYQTELRAVGLLDGPRTEDFALSAEPIACAAPGYETEYVYFEDFEADDGGYTVEGYASWEWGVPTSGPGHAHSGSRVWATNLSGPYFKNEDGYLVSPDIDLSDYAGRMVFLSWWQWLHIDDWGYDVATADVSNDGGASWATIDGPMWGWVDFAWTKHSFTLDPSYAVSNFRLRFHLMTSVYGEFPGYYVDDVSVGVAAMPPTLYAENFEGGNGGYTTSGTTSWAWGTPTRGPSGAHSGSRAWATNLSGNYGNNENGYLTSPIIDLSSGEASTLLLSWWQWLQTESGYDFASVEISDGSTWTVVFTTSGIMTTDWMEMSILLDPSYTVSNFRVRFGLQSDGTVTYPGFYVDDVRIVIYTGVPPAPPCRPHSGGLVVGNVYDANTSAALNGATVVSSQCTATAQATPYDNAVDDGFYIVFAAAGSQVLTATMTGGYGADVQTPTVMVNDIIRQDFHLPAGWLFADPPALQATLDVGASTTLNLTLENQGGLEAGFELWKKPGQFFPAYLSTVVVPGYQAPTGDKTYTGQGGRPLDSRQSWRYSPPPNIRLSSSGATVLIVMAGEATQIQAMLQAYPDLAVVDYFDAREETPTLEQLLVYDTVIVGSNYAFANPVAMGDVLADYVDAGGTVIQTAPTFYDSEGGGWGLQGRFMDEGYSPFVGSGDWWTWADLGDFDPFHPIMEEVTHASDFYRQMVDLNTDAKWVASWTDDEFIATKGSVVALNTLIHDGYAWTGDIPLIVHNGIVWLVGDVPWLSTDPITGTVPSLGSQIIHVTLDAGVPEITQPGDYTAGLSVRTDTPYYFVMPVTMTVNVPAGWGKLAGTIIGLDRCDAPGAPLAKATVEITGMATTEADTSGAYGYWLPQDSYTVTISAPGYVTQTFAATIIAGQISTHDAELRRDVPCTGPAATALNVTVPQGRAATETLILDNSGAGKLSFTFFESLFDLKGVSTSTASALPGGAFGLPMQTGPASLLSLADRAGSPEGMATPLSGWFGGLDLPGGLAHYGFAQCAERPDSYYVFGGIDGTFLVSAKSWRYDAASNAWTRLADMPAGSEAPSAVCHQGRVYVMGGSGTEQFYTYDLVTDTWATGVPLPRGVEGAAAAAWGGKVYLVGGDDDFAPFTGVSDRVDIYDIASGTWSQGTPLPVAVSSPGYVQLGPYLYLVGGWGVDAPLINVSATQRYDLETDTWELGPAFASARADLALAATAQALYAMAGDRAGSGYWDATKKVERLDLTVWPDGAWTDTNDPLPDVFVANSAGFCTQALMDSSTAEVWSVGGMNVSWWFIIHGRTLFREAPGEACYSIYTDVPWLSEAPALGTVPGDDSGSVTITFDATDITPGVYAATLAISANDSGTPLAYMPVRLTVTAWYKVFLPLITRRWPM